MANPFSKGWKHLMASFDQKIDENADPKVQIKQAVEGAKKRHQEITESDSEIIGNQRQLELRLNRLLKSQDDLQTQTRSEERRVGKEGREQWWLRQCKKKVKRMVCSGERTRR